MKSRYTCSSMQMPAQPRVEFAWQKGPPVCYYCTVCKRAVGETKKAVYRHRARYHVGCRGVLTGVPGAKREQFVSEEQRAEHKQSKKKRRTPISIYPVSTVPVHAMIMGTQIRE